MKRKNPIESIETLERLDEIKDKQEREKYKELFTEWENKEYNKERSHKRKRDSRSFEVLENPPPNPRRRIPQANMNLRNSVDFEDIIFSGNPAYLHELVSDGVLSSIIKKLTPKQKEVLYYKAVMLYTEKEVSKILGISDRRVREIYEAAMYRIRGQIYPIIKFRRKLKTDDKYRKYAIKHHISTTKTERKFVGKADDKIKKYYE